MLPEEFLSWLDKEIEDADKYYKAEASDLITEYWNGVLDSLRYVKTEFITIQFPIPLSSITEKRKQAQANGYDDYCEAHDLPYRNECPLCPPLTDELPENPSNFTDGLT